MIEREEVECVKSGVTGQLIANILTHKWHDRPHTRSRGEDLSSYMVEDQCKLLRSVQK